MRFKKFPKLSLREFIEGGYVRGLVFFDGVNDRTIARFDWMWSPHSKGWEQIIISYAYDTDEERRLIAWKMKKKLNKWALKHITRVMVAPDTSPGMVQFPWAS